MSEGERVHIAGPVRHGSRQVTQRCIRCGFALMMEPRAAGLNAGKPVGAMVTEQGVNLDAMAGRSLRVHLCELTTKRARTLVR